MQAPELAEGGVAMESLGTMRKASDHRRIPTLAHKVEFILYRAAEKLLGLASLTTVVRVGQILGLAAWALSGKHRRLVTRNIRIATANAAPSPIALQQCVRETFRQAGGNLLGSLRAVIMDPKQLRDHITIEGLEHLQNPVETGRGVIIVWSHMGNWEVLAQLVPELGPMIRGGPIYRPLSNPLLDQLTLQRRTRQGAIVFSKEDGFMGPAALLRSGGVLSVMSDQRAGGHGDLCPFFGRLSSCTPLPSLLARRTGAAMVSLAIASQSSGHWRLTLRPIPDKSGTPVVMKHLELAMRDSLPDVFWFHDRWRVDSTRPLSFYTKESPSESAGHATVPTRLLASLPTGKTDAIACLTTLLELRPDIRIDLLEHGEAITGLPGDPRIVLVPYDPSTPDEQMDGFLQRCDAAHPAPLDFVLLLDGNKALARAARRLHLRGIIGAGVSGKPWTRSFPHPESADEWRELASALVFNHKGANA
ncbi:MAG: hypothetical protein EAZ65_05565 [Verrucomicrobia bacterium]|nr:MAG: hypothetical protein EAZ84_01110 [Verrucomicrobiota bacterium]TAE87853.1 MAG: hypothetical protein EAZ82_06460 [Verrucomicrobiota bacterium]TAF25596.1 MAG: hypothetical protein EAZ71_07385 [Verrucomicrobiota bacterium]TAF41337.1 MAG: hypothetical protein EAZ65_05565 [Verrucomicrobiota bacterium]